MTEQNRQNNIDEELSRAQAALGAADLLTANHYVSEAVSRLYYFVLYEIRALLLTKTLEPRSHEGALRLFSLHFVKDGPFPPELAHVFSKLMKYREEADYNPSYAFTAEDYTRLRKEALVLSQRIRAHLAEKGNL